MSNDSFSYCADLVKTCDEDRWLAAQYASPDGRRRLLALYAFQCELRRIPGAVSEPPLGEIRLQWWRDALQEIRDGKAPRAHPVVEEIAEASLADQRYEALFDCAIDAQARTLYGEEFTDIEDLVRWLSFTDGSVDAIAVLLLGGDEALADRVRIAGGAFALAREGRVLAPSLAADVSGQAIKTSQEATPALKKADANIAPALLHLSLTKLYARKGARPFAVSKRLRLFLAMACGWF